MPDRRVYIYARNEGKTQDLWRRFWICRLVNLLAQEANLAQNRKAAQKYRLRP